MRVAIVGLLEREREIETLRGGLERAAASEGKLLLIEGAAGVGKTVLTRLARRLAEKTGAIVLEARGSELEQPFGFGVVRERLEAVIARSASRAALFAGAAGPAARLFEPDEHQSRSVEAGFEALHSL